MTTPAKTVSPIPAKRSSKRSEVLKSAEKPFLRFQHLQKLWDKTIAVLNMVESAEVATVHSDQLTELAIELTDSGMDRFFLQSDEGRKSQFRRPEVCRARSGQRTNGDGNRRSDHHRTYG